MNDPWQVTLLEGLRAERGEQVITRFKTQKVAALFAYLAYYRRHAHSREVLIELLWPESEVPTLRNSLSVALSSLRSQFEPPGVPQGTVIRADRFSVGLNPATVTTDAARFEEALQAAARASSSLERAQHLAGAVELYQGNLLPGFYEEWILPEQARLSGLFLDAVGALVTHLEGVGEIRAALAHSRHAVAVDPLREEGQQHLIRLLAAEGQPGAALRQYREYERLREEEVGAEPSAALRALLDQIEKASGVSAPAGAAPAPRRLLPSRPPPGEPATLTFLLTDIEGSTRMAQRDAAAYSAARERHHTLLRQEFASRGGQELKETGEGFIVAFPTAGSALVAAVAAQQALAGETWAPETGPLKVRMALHTGDVQPGSEEGQYQGLALHHVSRLVTAAHGGQILISEATASLAHGAAEAGVRLVDLGSYRLRDLPEARRLFQVEYSGMEETRFGPLAAEAGHKANLPLRFNRFFGREAEMARLREMLLSPAVRLVTLTGPAGNGKTRLALEVAERLAEPFAGAVYYVPLADLRDPALIPGAILDSLGIPRLPQREPLERTVEALSEKPTLLLLDNLEQLLSKPDRTAANGVMEQWSSGVRRNPEPPDSTTPPLHQATTPRPADGADVVQALLSRVPSLKLLVTSRQLLGLSAEREFALSPLPTPVGEESPEQLSLYNSVQLFIDRAQQVMPHFHVSNANAAAVAALVGGLEGIPLAIELAAARVQVLTPAQMLALLSPLPVGEGAGEGSHRFDFLASHKRDVAERQRTLRGALEWSYRLLVPELQRFFARLSIFRGGWSVEAAEAVCEEPLALDYLEQLRECSLVHHSETDPNSLRFGMLETLREYGQERLTELKEAEALQQRHISCFLALAEGAVGKLRGPEQRTWLDRLEAEHDNLRAVFDRCFASSEDSDSATPSALESPRSTHGRGEAALRLAAALGTFWALRGYFTEGRQRLAQALAGGAGTAVDRAMALSAAGHLAYLQADYLSARALQEESLALRRALEDRGGVAASLRNLGHAAYQQGDLETARSLCEESLAACREQGDRPGIAASLNVMGVIAYSRGEYEAARLLLEEHLAVARELGDRMGVATSLQNQGVVAYRRGDLQAARSLSEESMAITRELGNGAGIAFSLHSLGKVASAQEDYGAARPLLMESLAMRRELGDRLGIVASLESLAELASAAQGPPGTRGPTTSGVAFSGAGSRAARLSGAAEALRETIGAPLLPSVQEPHARVVDRARELLDPSEFSEAWEAGRAMSWEEAVAYALEE